MQIAGQNRAQAVSSHLASHQGHAVDVGLGVDLQPKFCGPLVDGGGVLRLVGAGAQRMDAPAEEEVAHGGIAHHNGLIDMIPQLRAPTLLEITQHGVEYLHDDALEASQAIIVLIGVADP